jgi:hypothetical protein
MSAVGNMKQIAGTNSNSITPITTIASVAALGIPDEGSIFYVSGVNAKDIAAGPNSFITVGENAKFAPGFASPDSSHIVNLVANCDRIETRIHTLAQQNGVIGVQGQRSGVRQAASGIAKEWDFRAEEAVLQETALAAAKLEEKIAELFGRYRKTTIDYTVTYPKQFSPSYSMDRVDELIKIIEEPSVPKALSDAAWQEITEELWNGDQDVIDAITAGIELEKKSRTQSINEGNQGPVGGMGEGMTSKGDMTNMGGGMQ